MADNPNSFLMGSGSVPSAKFPGKGASVEGVICEEPKLQQQRDINTQAPKFWPNGDPQMQLVVTLQTDEVDDEIEDDDGKRRIYVKFKMREAIADAVKAAGANGLAEGGWLKVTCTGAEKPKVRGHNGAKLYSAEYEAPDPTAASADFLEGDDEAEEAEEAPPARPARKAAAPARPAKAAAKAAASRPARARRSAEFEEEDDPGF